MKEFTSLTTEENKQLAMKCLEKIRSIVDFVDDENYQIGLCLILFTEIIKIKKFTTAQEVIDLFDKLLDELKEEEK